MFSENISRIEQCRILLKRAAWKLQYKSKKQIQREGYELNEYSGNVNFEENTISDIYIEQLLNKIPSLKCRYIIQRVVIEEFSEKLVAKELHMSQQGVNKWKKLGLKILKEQILN